MHHRDTSLGNVVYIPLPRQSCTYTNSHCMPVKFLIHMTTAVHVVGEVTANAILCTIKTLLHRILGPLERSPPSVPNCIVRTRSSLEGYHTARAKVSEPDLYRATVLRLRSAHDGVRHWNVLTEIQSVACHAVDGTLLALLEDLRRSLLHHPCFKEDLFNQAYEVGGGRVWWKGVVEG